MLFPSTTTLAVKPAPTASILLGKCAIAFLPVIWVGLFFPRLRWRGAGLETLFPSTTTLAVKPAPTASILLGKPAIASFPVIWVGLFFARLGWRGAGLDTLFPSTATLAVKPPPTASTTSAKFNHQPWKIDGLHPRCDRFIILVGYPKS